MKCDNVVILKRFLRAAAGGKRAHICLGEGRLVLVCVGYVLLSFSSMYVCVICTSITIVLEWWPKEHTCVSLLLFFRLQTRYVNFMEKC